MFKHRLLEEGNESVTNCHQLKLVASDGKAYSTDVANTEQNLTCKKVYKNSDFLAPLV
ncbi:MAG: hypothetical protein BWY55_00204 [archaeon ADurb.Bin336]|nr:MAG: hypothetical protein BWY55_00204 [archaeon ADurb.Bin336]